MSIIRATSASDLMQSAEFLGEWAALHSQCPWATVFQSPGYVATWTRAYSARYESVIVCGRAAGRALCGAMFLALDRETGELVFAGAHQAEYQTFISGDCDPNMFARAALRALGGLGLQQPLRFQFLAPGTPMGWFKPRETDGYHCLSQAHVRPLVDVSDVAHIRGWLEKKRYRARLARLRRRGNFRVVRVDDSKGLLPYYDAIMASYDLRQGAVHHATPFRSDPQKRDFYLSLLDQGDQLHVTLLLDGEEVIAASLGHINRGGVALGVVAHSPRFADCSPGSLLLILLMEQLATQGYTQLDLTPGGEHKDRFASHTDTVHAVQVHWRLVPFVLRSLRMHVGRVGRTIAGRLGVERDVVRGWVQRLGRYTDRARLARAPRTIWRILKARCWDQGEFRIYAAPPPGTDFRLGTGVTRVREAHLEDLLHYCPESGDVRDYWRFLSTSLERVEHKHVPFTSENDSLLLHYSWLDTATRKVGTSFGSYGVPLQEPAGVLWDDFTHPSARGQGLHTESICKRLNSLERDQPGRRAYVGILADNRPSRSSYEHLGFQYIGSVWRRARLWRVTVTSDFTEVSPPKPRPGASGTDRVHES